MRRSSAPRRAIPRDLPRLAPRALAPILVAVASAAVLPVAAAAPASSAGYLERMDSDGDGRVSLAEYLDWMGHAFRGMDRNGDGVLTADELPGGRGAPLRQEQHRARLAAAFARQDVDGDGHLDARELAAPPR